jgi:hypothetical protein
VAVSGNNQMFYIKSMRLGSDDMTRKVFEYKGGVAADLEIVLGTDGGSVSGMVTDNKGAAIGGASVTLWPANLDYTQRNGGAITGRSRHDGTFLFPLVPPGEYSVLAVTDLPDPGLAEYPPFVSRLAGERIKVGPKQGTTANIHPVSQVLVERAIAEIR